MNQIIVFISLTSLSLSLSLSHTYTHTYTRNHTFRQWQMLTFYFISHNKIYNWWKRNILIVKSEVIADVFWRCKIWVLHKSNTRLRKLKTKYRCNNRLLWRQTFLTVLFYDTNLYQHNSIIIIIQDVFYQYKYQIHKSTFIFS